MSKSKAQKKREKLVREGRLNPEINRSPYAKLDLSTRRTKTKKDHLYRMKHKNRHPKQEENGSFYFTEKCMLPNKKYVAHLNLPLIK
jgi:CMP-N-acetylneuraminic acid synthetase